MAKGGAGSTETGKKGGGRRVGVWIIMGFLFVGLMGFGATGFGGRVQTLGTVGDKDIPVSDYTSALNSQIRAFSQQFGTPLGFAEAQLFGLPQAVLGQVVTDRALDNEASHLGLSAGDARIRDQILITPAFQDLSGSFDRDQYRGILQQQGLTEEEFETGLREDFSRSLLQASVVGGIAAPEIYAERLSAYVGERRDFTWSPVGAGDLTGDLPAPDSDAARAHYDANPEAYTRPEVREVSYAILTPEMIQDEVEVDEARIQALYDERIGQFVQPERRLVERLVYPDAAAAEAALARLSEDDVTFEDLVEARGLDISDADMGDVRKDDLGDAGDAVFAAEPGDVVGPLDTGLGPALFRVNVVLAAQEITLDEARDDLRNELAFTLAARVIDGERDRIEDLLAGGAAVSDIAAATAMEERSLGWSQGSSEGDAAYDGFRAAAAGAEVGDFPELVELGDGGLLVLQLDEITPPALIPFDEVAGEAATNAAQAAAEVAILARAEEIAASLSAGDSFVDNGLVGRDETGFTRRDFLAATPPNFLTKVFSLAPGEADFIAYDGGAIVVRLDAISAADDSDPAVVAERESLAETAEATIAQELYGAFARAIQEGTEIRLDDAAINAVNAQFQ